MKNIITKKITYEQEYIESIKCDICGKEFKAEPENDSFIDMQEFFSFTQNCGYGSVFGDGNVVNVDICQDCMKGILDNKDAIYELIKKPKKKLMLTYVGPKRGSNVADKVFEIGQNYEIEILHVNRYSSEVKIKDIDGVWNSELFKLDLHEVMRDIKNYDIQYFRGWSI